MNNIEMAMEIALDSICECCKIPWWEVMESRLFRAALLLEAEKITGIPALLLETTKEYQTWLADTWDIDH